MRIVIPTLGRIRKQRTFESLPMDLRRKVVFVVQRHEYDEFAQLWGSREIAILPDNVKKIGATRQWVWENFRHERFAMFDDDLYVRIRDYLPDADVKWPCRNAEAQDWRDMFAWAEGKMDAGIPVCSMRTTDIIPNVATWPDADNVKIFTNIMFDGPALEHADLDYDRGVDAAEDLDAQLQLLSQGIPTVSSSRFNVNIKYGAVTPGGCDVWRTVETHNAVMRRLAELWPRYVRLYEKVAPTGTLAGQKKLAANISWKKCYRDGCARLAIEDTGLF